MKFLILLCFVEAFVFGDIKAINDRNSELFKYNPDDAYTLPEDIDDDKPAVIFNGDVMKARVEKLQSINGKNKFKLDLKTQNGIEVTSVGKLKDDKTFVVSGSYSFTGADGKRYKTRYTADEFGYHPITELDLDLPEPIPFQPATKNFKLSPFKDLNPLSFGPSIALKNRFQFLNQKLDSEQFYSPLKGSGQSGDDYSYNNENNPLNRGNSGDSQNYYGSNSYGQDNYQGDSYQNGNGNGNGNDNDDNDNNHGNDNDQLINEYGQDINVQAQNGNPQSSNINGFGRDDDSYRQNADYYNQNNQDNDHHSGDGYNYNIPRVTFEAPSRQYLPVQ